MSGKTSVYAGRWRVVESLSEGGQGWVYKVVDTTEALNGEHLLKRLKNIKRLDRFKREIQALQNLVHPNVLTIVDAGPDHDPPFLVTVLCTGDLTLQMTSYPNLLSRLRLFQGICQGVSAAHSAGITHRDIKPENILIKPDLQPVVADFGLCYFEDGERHTLVDEAIGPRRFIAPELEEGRADEISPRSDIYSLGKLLYWLIAGDVFTREKHREDRYDLVKRLGDPRLERLNPILDKMITLEPSKAMRTRASSWKK